MFAFKIIVFVCFFHAYIGDTDDVTAKLEDDDMFIKDNFGGKTNLFISGRNLTFECSCENGPCTGMAVKRDTDTKVKSDENIPIYYLGMALTHNTEFGDYKCEANNKKKSDRTLKLNYLLCDDRDHLCKSLSCDQAGNDDGGLHFCVLKGNVREPTCELLDYANCPRGSFGSQSIGFPCLENGDKGTSVCHSFAKNQKVVFTSKEANCKDSDVLKVTSELSKGERIYLGSIGELGSSLEFFCKPLPCKLKWTESTYTYRPTPFHEGQKVLIKQDASFVSRIHVTTTTESAEVDTYFFNVYLSSATDFKRDASGQLTCKLLGAPVPNDQQELFTYFLKIFRDDNHLVAETKTKTELKVDGNICGQFRCETSITVKHCSPYFEKTKSNISETISVSENCKKPPDEDAGITTIISAVVGVIVCLAIIAGVIVLVVFLFKKKSAKTLPKKKVTGKKPKDRSISIAEHSPKSKIISDPKSKSDDISERTKMKPEQMKQKEKHSVHQSTTINKPPNWILSKRPETKVKTGKPLAQQKNSTRPPVSKNITTTPALSLPTKFPSISSVGQIKDDFVKEKVVKRGRRF